MADGTNIEHRATIYQGDSTPKWLISHSDVDGVKQNLSANYACRVAVNGTAIDRVVENLTEDNLNFIGFLTLAESAALAANQRHKVVFELTNLVLVPPLKKEIHISLLVKPQGRQ